MSDTIRCPKCGSHVEIGEALAAQVADQVRTQVDAQVSAKVRQAAEAAQRRAREESAVEVQALRVRAEETARALAEAKKGELELRRRQEALEREKEELDLTVQRKLDAERARVRAEARKAADDESAMLLRERSEQIEGMKRTIEELKRKAEQGSMQLQGEVQELCLEETLRAEFPHDQFEPIAKGVRGADLIQRVRGPNGQECGVILWESKRAKHWANEWLPTLRDNQRAIRADVAALVTQALPKGAAPVGCVDDVWIAAYSCFVGLAQALRQGILAVAAARTAAQGRDEKMALLYEYLTGPHFRNRVLGLLDPFAAMKDDLAKEKAATMRMWAKREKQIERALTAASGLYGDLEGIVGAALPELAQLGVPALEEGHPAA